jgi:glutamyl-tRNA reductase
MPHNLISIGIDHHRAPVELREKLVFSSDEIRAALKHIQNITDEALLISTCNRTELYVRPTNDTITQDYLIDVLFEEKHIADTERTVLRHHIAKLSYCDALLHLFEVTAGVDSQIIGDQQIFGQVKEAFALAEESGTMGTFLTKLAHAVYRAAKRVRSETSLHTGAGTISYAAVEFARKVYDDLSQRTTLIIGAGDTAEIAAKHLLDKGLKTLIVANRTLDNAERLASELRTNYHPAKIITLRLDEITTQLPSADIIISSTANESILLSYDDIRSALQKRLSRMPLVLIDIAVPRDIDPKAATLPNVLLKDIDDLTSIVEDNIKKRKEDLPAAKTIITDEFKNFLDVFSRLEVGPTIKQLREHFEKVRIEELERQKSKLTDIEYKLFDEMTKRIMNRLLHSPTVMLKEPRSSKDDLQARIEMVRLLFALDENNNVHGEAE